MRHITLRLCSLAATTLLLLGRHAVLGLLLLDLLDHRREYFRDVDVLLRRRLQERTSKLPGLILAFLGCDVPLLYITLVAH